MAKYEFPEATVIFNPDHIWAGKFGTKKQIQFWYYLSIKKKIKTPITFEDVTIEIPDLKVKFKLPFLLEVPPSQGIPNVEFTSNYLEEAEMLTRYATNYLNYYGEWPYVKTSISAQLVTYQRSGLIGLSLKPDKSYSIKWEGNLRIETYLI